MQVQRTVFDSQRWSCRDDEDRVRLDCHALFDLSHGNARMALQQLIHDRWMVGCQVLDDNIGQPATVRDCLHESTERFKTSGGGPDTDHGNSCFVSFGHLLPEAFRTMTTTGSRFRSDSKPSQKD